jgi:hypothetical protein
MKLESCKVFAQLLEELVYEDSTAIGTLGNHPGGKELAQYLHTNDKLSHNTSYRSIPRISWTDLKNSDSWVLIKGDNGSGSVKIDNRGYTAVISKNGEISSKNSSRGDEIKSFLKGNLGKLRQYYLGQDFGEVRTKKSDRSRANPSSKNTIGSASQLSNKFQPLFIKATTQAIADSKGHLSIMIKNDAFDKASAKLSKIKYLQNILIELQNGEYTRSHGDPIARSISYSIAMAAAHYYPDISDEVYARANAQIESEGYFKILSDISQGDMKKLGTLLVFFKQGLLIL